MSRGVRRLLSISALLMACCPALAQGERVFFGILHSHTGYSDGSGLPREAYARARQQGKCDFFAITEHNHGINLRPKDGPASQIIANSPQNYNGAAHSLVAEANDATVPGVFVALYGQEYSTISSGNHVNVFDVPSVIDITPGKFDDLVDWLRQPGHFDTTEAPGIVQLNHPDKKLRDAGVEYGADDFGSQQQWIAKLAPLACTIEVLNGPGLSKTDRRPIPSSFQSSYFHYLSLGFRLAPTADHDNHYRTWGTLTTARTGVVCDELTKAKLLGAIRARHVYATSDSNLEVIARVNGALAGDVIDPPQTQIELPISISIKDRDEPLATYTIDVYSGVAGSGELPERVEQVDATNGDGQYIVEDVHFQESGQYILFILRQANAGGGNDTAWTAPVWFGLDIGIPESVDQVIASKKSKLYHTNPECSVAKGIKPENRIRGAAAKKGRTPHQCKPAP